MPTIPRVVCSVCRVPMVPTQNGVSVEALSAIGSYYKIEADVYSCPECAIEVITGFADRPYAEQFQEGYQAGGCDVRVQLERRKEKTTAS